MSQQTINVGASPNDGTGTPLRTAFQYTNSNFSELYTAVGPSGNNIVVPGAATITGDLTVDTNTFYVKSSTNQVGIGTTSPDPSFAFDITASSDARGRQWFANTAFVGTGDLSTGFQIRTLGTGTNGLKISNSSNTTEWMRIDSSGNVGIGVTPSAGAGCLQLVSGVNFPATQVASANANTLDDYEEGTFTPVVQGSTTAGTATYVGRTGKYTKIGNLVNVQIYIDYNSHTGVGDTRISGLPFTNSSAFAAATVGYANAITVSANYYLGAYVDAGNSWILLNQIPVAGGTNQTVPIDPAGTLVISAVYTV